MDRNFCIHYYICIHDKLEDLESETAAVDCLFAICKNENVFSSDELDRLLETYPNSTRTLKCMFHPWGEPSRTVETYPLHVACRNNAPINVIQALIEAWPGTLQSEAADRLPLHEACTCALSLPTIELLVEAWPESIQKATTDGCLLPLHLALQNPEVSLEIVQFLVQQWPESLQKDSDEWRCDPLQLALQSCCSDHIIRYLVQQAPRSVQKCQENGNTALHYACYKHWPLPLIQFLIEQWPEAVKIRARHGYFDGLPLMVALHQENISVETVDLLIDMWPEAVKEKHMLNGEEICLLTELTAWRRGKINIEIMSLLIDRCPELVRIPDKHGELPFNWAWRCGASAVVLNLMMHTYPDSL